MEDNIDNTHCAEAQIDQHQELLDWDRDGSSEKISVFYPTVAIKLLPLYSYFVETSDDR